MRKILVIQHTINEGLGLLEECLTEKSWIIDIRNMEEGASLPATLDDYQAMLIMGGPMGAYQDKEYPYLVRVQDLILLADRTALPTVGICLGAQIIARALGAHVGPHTQKEIGWFSLEINSRGQQDALFMGINSPLWVFQWHQDTFDLPVGGRLLASTSDCFNQAFSYGDYLWGLQFHPEVSPEMVACWVANGQEDLTGLPGDPASEILEATRKLWEMVQSTNLQLLSNLERILNRS